MLEIYQKTKDLPHEGILNLEHRYNDARNWHSTQRLRHTENWHFYWGLNPELGQGQWPSEVVDQMLQQRRQLLTYNFAKVIVDTMAGGIMQNLFDPNFIPVNSEITKVTQAIKKAMYSDKELMNWETAWLEFIIHGLVGEGVLKMKISKEYDKLGNIGFSPIMPGAFTADPSWKTRSTKELKVCWQESWYTPYELREIFPEKTDLIDRTISEIKTKLPTYGTNTGIVPFNSSENKWGDKLKVISEFHMVEKKITRDYVLIDGEEKSIPEMPDMEKPKWLNENLPNWDPDMTFQKPEIVRYCYVDIACPNLQLGDYLYSGKSIIQCGQVPFFVWSASMHNGERHTVIDSVKDACRNINYWESMCTYKMQIEGGGGSKFVDPAGFKDNETYLDYCNNNNNPAKTFETKPGLLVDGKGLPVRPTIESTIRSDIFNRIDHIINTILPQISKVVPAMSGRTESQNQTSGRLFQMLKLQSDQQVFTTHFGLKVCFADIYDAYFNQAIELYSNEDIERTFTFSGGKESITLNEEVDAIDGSTIVLNKVSDLKNVRHKTIISEAKGSPSEKMANLETMSEYLQSLAPIAQFKPATIGLITQKMAENIDQFNEEDKDELVKIGKKESELQLAQIDLAISMAKVQKAQADSQLAQMGQGVIPPTGVTPGQPQNPTLGNGMQLPNGIQGMKSTGLQGPEILPPTGPTRSEGAL